MTRPHYTLLCLALAACKSEPTPTPVVEQAVAAASETGEAQAPAQQGAPKIACDEPIYDFGAVKLTDKIEHVFKIRNVGDGDLKIERVQKT